MSVGLRRTSQHHGSRLAGLTCKTWMTFSRPGPSASVSCPPFSNQTTSRSAAESSEPDSAQEAEVRIIFWVNEHDQTSKRRRPPDLDCDAVTAFLSSRRFQTRTDLRPLLL